MTKSSHKADDLDAALLRASSDSASERFAVTMGARTALRQVLTRIEVELSKLLVEVDAPATLDDLSEERAISGELFGLLRLALLEDVHHQLVSIAETWHDATVWSWVDSSVVIEHLSQGEQTEIHDNLVNEHREKYRLSVARVGVVNCQILFARIGDLEQRWLSEHPQEAMKS